MCLYGSVNRFGSAPPANRTLITWEGERGRERERGRGREERGGGEGGEKEREKG